MAIKKFWEAKAFPHVLDPVDHKPRPFCDTVGRLVTFSFHSGRYVAPTPEEDRLWCASGQTLIDSAPTSAINLRTRNPA